MTLAQPAAATLTINDLINKVKANLQNRADVSETQTNPEMRPSAWIRDTLRELTANWPFPELQVAGPLTTIGPGLGYQKSNYMYPVSQFLNSGDDMTSSEDPTIFLTPQQQQAAIMQGATASKFVGTASGTVAYPMDYLTVKAIQPMLFIPGGIPFRYTRYGNMFWFGTQPGTNFSVYLPYQRRHPFHPDLPTSPVFISQEWEDIVGIGAAERGAVVLRWNDQASYLHQLLYGDPASQMKDGSLARPGLLSARIFQPERDRRLSPVQISPMVSRY
jgi:hypothetical protein